jgi:hypothetical protein
MIDVGQLITVFRMEEIGKKTRANVIIALGRAMNDTMAMNFTEPLVYELVKVLDPENRILTDEHFLKLVEIYNK